MNYYSAVLKKYAVFNGRSQRAEYWYWFLFNLIVGIILNMFGYVIGKNMASIIILLYTLAIIIPNLAVVVRRLHDVGKSGWWLFWWFIINAVSLLVIVIILRVFGKNSSWLLIDLFLLLIPLFLDIWLFVLLVTDSNQGENKYGPNPKEVAINPNPLNL